MGGREWPVRHELVRKDPNDLGVLRRLAQRKDEQKAHVAVLVKAHEAAALRCPLNLESSHLGPTAQQRRHVARGIAESHTPARSRTGSRTAPGGADMGGAIVSGDVVDPGVAPAKSRHCRTALVTTTPTVTSSATARIHCMAGDA